MLHRPARTLPALLAAAIACTAVPVSAGAATADAIILQCAQDGVVKPGYSQADLAAAMAALPADVREYSPCVDAITAAQQAIALAAAQRARGTKAPSGLSGAAQRTDGVRGGVRGPEEFAGGEVTPAVTTPPNPETARALHALELGAAPESVPLHTASMPGVEARDRPIAPLASAAAAALLLAGSGLALARPGILRRRRPAE
ncbi:MAG: hypothetical protein PGN13_08815 [Patulibacter minatonensis]